MKSSMCGNLGICPNTSWLGEKPWIVGREFIEVMQEKRDFCRSSLCEEYAECIFSYKIESCSLDNPFVDAETKTMLDASHSDLNLLFLKKLLPSLINLFGVPNTVVHV